MVGFGLAGDENAFPFARFVKAFQKVHQAGIQCTAHAGEFAGPENIWNAINLLPLKRIGHGTSCLQDPLLVNEIKKRKLTLEICLSSNVGVKLFPHLSAHPLKKLIDAGIKVTLTMTPIFLKLSDVNMN